MMRSSLLDRRAGWLHVFALETAKQSPYGKTGKATGRIREGQRAGKGKRGELREDGKLRGVVKSVKEHNVAR